MLEGWVLSTEYRYGTEDLGLKLQVPSRVSDFVMHPCQNGEMAQL